MLETAKRETEGNFSALIITVFTDSREVLTTTQQSFPRPSSPYLRRLIHQRALDLKNNGRSVTIRWIPSHVGLVGHDRANQSVKDRARKGGKPIEQSSSLTHIRKRLVESRFSELAKWHVAKGSKREASRRGFYIPRLKTGMDELLGSTPKRYASQYLQLKVEHGAIGTVPGQNRGNRNPQMLVVRVSRAVCRAPVYKVPEVEETKEEVCEKLKRKKH